MNFKWIEPATIKNSPRVKVKYESIEYKNRIAAVSIDTDQIAYIFDNVIAAARDILKIDYKDIECGQDTIQYAACKIAEAVNDYHKECLGYWWKKIY